MRAHHVGPGLRTVNVDRVTALLPGRSDPTPILRLHYQGSADHWAIAIYKDSAGQYTEAELPGSFGEATGTPEEGTDDILVRYADPEPETDRAHPDTRQNCESRVLTGTSSVNSAGLKSITRNPRR